jgi:hypothetical protein
MIASTTALTTYSTTQDYTNNLEHTLIDVEKDIDECNELLTAEEKSLSNSVYHEIKRKLIERGIPEEEIAFIHDANKPSQKAALYQAMNEGDIRVLIGSTSKMGVGMNVQRRLIALHHLDTPWRPRDIKQRLGRIVRQGNLYEDVMELQYVTEGSFDAFMWGILKNKAQFISQIMAGEVTARTAEDVGEMVLNAAQVAAIASGNPKILEHVATEVELVKLDRLYAAYNNNQYSLKIEAGSIPRQLAALKEEIEEHKKSIEKRKQLADGEFSMQLRTVLNEKTSVEFNKRSFAGAQLRQLSLQVAEVVNRSPEGSVFTIEVGEYRGFKLYVRAKGISFSNPFRDLFNVITNIVLQAEGVQIAYEAKIGESDTGITQSIDHRLREIENNVNDCELRYSKLLKRLNEINAEIGKPWEHEFKYKQLTVKYNRLSSELRSTGVELGSAFIDKEIKVTECSSDVNESNVQHNSQETPRNLLTGLEETPLRIKQKYIEELTLYSEDILTDQQEIANVNALEESTTRSVEAFNEVQDVNTEVYANSLKLDSTNSQDGIVFTQRETLQSTTPSNISTSVNVDVQTQQTLFDQKCSTEVTTKRKRKRKVDPEQLTFLWAA